MSDSIDRDTVKQVARLARIYLAEKQLDAASQHLADILDYVGQLDEVDLPHDVQPFFGAIESVNAVRTDVVEPSVDREMILRNAPDTDGKFYFVPPVFK